MPVDLTQLINQASSSSSKPNKPTYFHTTLTGSGGKVGVFNQQTDTLTNNVDLYFGSMQHLDLDLNSQKRDFIYQSQFSNLEMDDSLIPSNFQFHKKHNYKTSLLSTLKTDEHSHQTVRFTNLPQFLKVLPTVDLFATTNQTTKFKVGMLAESVDHFEYQDKASKSKYAQVFRGHMDLIFKIERPHATMTSVHVLDNAYYLDELSQTTKQNQLFIIKKFDPYQLIQDDHYGVNVNPTFSWFQSFIDSVDQQYHFANYNGQTAMSSLVEVLSTISVSNGLIKQASANQASVLNDTAKLLKFYQNQAIEHQMLAQAHVLMQAYDLIKLEEPNLTDENYQRFYHDVKYQTLNRPTHKASHQYKVFNFSKLIAVNTRLALTHQISQLKDNHNVYQFVPTKPDFQTNETYSPEQLNVIKSTEPYSIVVAGAGSGKSHTLLGRLNYLKQNDIELKHVLVTSFTNTAAQNIINRFHGGINSLTNANLFHKIYQENFDHELTNDATIVNLLNMVSDQSKLMQKSATILDTKNQLVYYLNKAQSKGFAKVDLRKVTEQLINLINDRLTDIITILDSIHQTSLMLEPIIINALMQNQATINYPSALSDLDFIITDESQDTSTFEYILLLKLAHINDAQLMIIGDSNQTLYQFRNANPDFLNALEKSTTFKCYTMSTNYRSQQSILTMTNQFLDVLKTNQNAKLQLHANQYVNLTKADFKDTVQLTNLILNSKAKKQAQIKNEITESIMNRQDITEWVCDQYRNHKQIAIMSYRNNDTMAIGQAVEQIIRNNFNVDPKVGYTRQPGPKPNTWLSDMLSHTQDPGFEAKAKVGHLTLSDFKHSFSQRLNEIANHRKFQQGLVNQFAIDAIKKLFNSVAFNVKLQAFNQRQISFSKLMGYVSVTLIHAETRQNNVTRLVQNQNQTDWHKCDVVVSTIHSAKGLEFDSVICYFDETHRNATSQENLRLYGVALTRAKDQELIINRPKLKGQQNPVPSAFGSNQVDMFATPMRTAYQRVLMQLP